MVEIIVIHCILSIDPASEIGQPNNPQNVHPMSRWRELVHLPSLQICKPDCTRSWIEEEVEAMSRCRAT